MEKKLENTELWSNNRNCRIIGDAVYYKQKVLFSTCVRNVYFSARFWILLHFAIQINPDDREMECYGSLFWKTELEDEMLALCGNCSTA